MREAKRRKFRHPPPFLIIIPPDAGKTWLDALKGPAGAPPSQEPSGPLIEGELGRIEGGVRFISTTVTPPRHNLTMPSLDNQLSTCTKCGLTFNLENPWEKEEAYGYCHRPSLGLDKQEPKLRFLTDTEMEGIVNYGRRAGKG